MVSALGQWCGSHPSVPFTNAAISSPMAQPDDGRSDASTTPPGFDWGDRTSVAPITVEVRFPRKEFHWLKQWELKDVKAMRTCDG
eukprot:43263-Prymnesium_polylepis.2